MGDDGTGYNFFKELKKLSTEEEAKTLVPATFLTIAVLDAIPTPTDIGYFYTEKWLDDHRNDPIVQRYHWVYRVLSYYGWDVLWYSLLFVVTYGTGKTFTDKIKVGVGLVSAGALLALIWKWAQSKKAGAASAQDGGRGSVPAGFVQPRPSVAFQMEAPRNRIGRLNIVL